ncbi:MAG: PorP/SprF family type IX secretion system membrane protein [Methylococcaceae bacterium]
MIKKLLFNLIVILFFCFVSQKQAEGQEYPWSLQYIFNMNTINPAYAGMWDEAGLMVSTRTNWVGFAKNPLFQEVAYHTPIKNQKSGWGINVRNMNTGREKQLFLTGDYSFQVRMDWNHYLRFGLRGGIVNFDNHMTDYQLYPDRIPDLEFSSDVRMFFMSIIGMGACYFNEDYFISFSIPQVINNSFSVNRSVFTSTREFKTAYLSGGYVFKLPKSMRLRPNLLCIATIGKPIYYDASAIMFFPSDLQFGLSMRSNGEMCFSGQYVLSNGMRIGYAADYAIGQDIRKYQVGTYEIMVGYDFNIYRKKYVKPNYF